MVYYGLWWSPHKRAMDAFIDETQKKISGTIRLRLYKGNITVLSRVSPHSLYWEKLATFEREEIYNQKDAEGFINLFGLPLKVQALLRSKR
jgi:argininosuccinate synthase